MVSYSPTNNPSLRVLRLVLLTIVLRPPWEAPGKAEKLGCWVNWRGVGIFLAKKGLMLQQTLLMILFSLSSSLQLEGYKSMSLFRGYVLDIHRLQN